MPVFSTVSRTCSFCSAVWDDQPFITGGTGSLICPDCVNRFHKAIAAADSSPDAIFREWQSMEKEQLLEQFLAILRQREQVDAFIREWVTLMKERQVSWSEIGNALGVSRQAAWERFSKPKAIRSA